MPDPAEDGHSNGITNACSKTKRLRISSYVSMSWQPHPTPLSPTADQTIQLGVLIRRVARILPNGAETTPTTLTSQRIGIR